VVAIERDSRCLPALAEISDHYPNRLEVIEGDALKIDFEAISGGGPVKIIANLPYNVGTQLLVNWLLPKTWPPFWQSLTLMFQREVGLRIVADADDDHYGRLGVLCGWRTNARMAFDVPPQAFTPPPKVTSSVVHLDPIANPIPCAVTSLEKVTHAAFGQRRKMLRQSLKPLGGEALLAKADIDPQRRAETLSVEEFCRLANFL
jgi:16S rRNA (adenine1518-N6/adenine1519-N6)-dimethyltransferase